MDVGIKFEPAEWPALDDAGAACHFTLSFPYITLKFRIQLPPNSDAFLPTTAGWGCGRRGPAVGAAARDAVRAIYNRSIMYA
jgi:hypothetical protein